MLLGLVKTEQISIHSLNEEWDFTNSRVTTRSSNNFNPLTQWRVRQGGYWWYKNHLHFNPLTQWRVRRQTFICDGSLCEYFNPLTQWRVRQIARKIRITRQLWFQSTHSMKSETVDCLHFILSIGFQSTHSMKSETPTVTTAFKPPSNFNPLTQWRVRQRWITGTWRATGDFNPLTQWRVRHKV